MTRHSSGPHKTAFKPLFWLLGLFLFILVGISVALWQAHKSDSTPPTGATTSGSLTTTTGAPSPTPVQATQEPTAAAEAKFSILAGGDVLPHHPVHDSARTKSGYDFGPLLAGIDDWVQGAGLALCHMEVPVTPEGEKISGYPMFAASPDIAANLRDQGWNGCSTASNHSVDRKFAGVVATLDEFDAVGLGHVGTARTAREAELPQIYTISVDGVDTVVAHLSATYGTNGLPIPSEQPWSVQLIDIEELIDQARTARSNGADLVLASIHAGNEYQTSPTEQQTDTAAALAASGEIDLMIGHHAHVPQPMAKLDGGPAGNGMWVAYGLGNMISNQDTQCCVPQTNSGLLLSAQITHRDGEPASVTDLNWIGITVDRLDGHRLHAFADILDLPNGVGKLSAAEIKARYDRVREAVGSQVSEQTAPSPVQNLSVTAELRARS